jgi:hypothetical protein
LIVLATLFMPSLSPLVLRCLKKFKMPNRRVLPASGRISDEAGVFDVGVAAGR